MKHADPTTTTDVAETLLGLDWRGMDDFAGMIAGLGTTDRHKVATKLIRWAEGIANDAKQRAMTEEDLPDD